MGNYGFHIDSFLLFLQQHIYELYQFDLFLSQGLVMSLLFRFSLAFICD